MTYKDGPRAERVNIMVRAECTLIYCQCAQYTISCFEGVMHCDVLSTDKRKEVMYRQLHLSVHCDILISQVY